MLVKIRTVVVFLLLLPLSFSVLANDTKERTALFSNADNAFIAAKEANAEILSPKNFAKANAAYKSAARRFKKKQKAKLIRKDLDEALTYYQKALDMTSIAEVTLKRGITARIDASKANAKSYAAEQWNSAEKIFADAAKRLEGGNLKRAQSKHDDAEKLYREAELIAIKANYLSETRQLIAIAKKNKADKYAPQTLTKAETLLARAAKELSENRYDTDQPKALAREAKYEAGHANYIAQKVATVANKKASIESLILEMEKPVLSIASSLDIVVPLDGSVPDVTESMRNEITNLQKDANELPQRQQDITVLETELAALEGRLGVQSKRLEKQEERRQRIESIKRMFSPRDAIVLEQDNKILIRLIGLSFESGRAEVNIDYLDLLGKVQRAINVFPQSKVTIEGHTDSFGSDETNLELSRERAVAVRTYIRVTDISGRKALSIVSKGFGETRPISTNDTAEGRAKNRRIDLIIDIGAVGD